MQSLFEHPLGPGGTDGFKHDGGEAIFSLPNGFQAYYLNTADGKPLRIFWRLMTVAEAEAFSKSDSSMDLDIFVRFAQDAAGRKLFDAEDKMKLRVSADSNIISRVARLMIGPARTLEDMVVAAEKN